MKEFLPRSQTARKPVLIASDLPAWGRVALAVGIPVLEKMGFQACSLPTALLSTHGAYPGAVLQGQTDFLEKAIVHLESLELEFSAFLTGFVADEAQFDLLAPLQKLVRSQGGLNVTDPVMGDNGKLYSFFDGSFVSRMRSFLACSDLVTPNLTEAALLLGTDPASIPATEGELREWCAALAKLGPRLVAVTSAPVHGKPEFTAVACYDAESGRFGLFPHKRVPVSYPGTGDLFASSLSGELLNGVPFPAAVRRTVSRVRRAVISSYRRGYDPRSGLCVL